MSDVSNVVPLPVAFRPHVIAGDCAPENLTPRPHFGLVRPEDRAQQENFKRIRRDLCAAERAALGDDKHVDPSLKVALAAKVAGVAANLEMLANEAKAYGLLKATVQLREHSGLLELCANEIDPTEPSEPA